MPRFRRVAGGQAGPTAVGILVPPGRRTTVIVRPRALALDLLPIEEKQGTTTVCELGHLDAPSLANRLYRALEELSADRPIQIETTPQPSTGGYEVRARLGQVRLLACPRRLGESYQPLLFGSREEAEQTASALRRYLCPPDDAEQELYLNTAQFAR